MKNEAGSKGSLVKATLVGAVASVVANVALYYLWSAAAGPLLVENPQLAALAPLPVGFVVMSSAVPALVAGGLFALLRRFAGKRAATVFLVLATVVLVLSMAPVAQVPMDGMGTRAALGLMHVVAAVCISLPLVRAGRLETAGGVA
jgi:hypothetical protein